MCPDNQLISAYFDNELDKQWSAGIEDHLHHCDKCRNLVSSYKKMNLLLADDIIPGESEIKTRMMGVINRRQKVVSTELFWRRHLNVSIPVVLAAAALMVIFFAGMLLGLVPFRPQEPQLVEEIESDMPNIFVQVINMDDAAAYILSDDSGFDLLITIPTSETWAVSGEPQMIREADYKRSQ